MTLGVFNSAAPSPPVPCLVDVLFRPPFVRLMGDQIDAVQNRATGEWVQSKGGVSAMRMRDGLARGDFAACFPSLAPPGFLANPAAVVVPVVPDDTIREYLVNVRREVQRA